MKWYFIYFGNIYQDQNSNDINRCSFIITQVGNFNDLGSIKSTSFFRSSYYKYSTTLYNTYRNWVSTGGVRYTQWEMYAPMIIIWLLYPHSLASHHLSSVLSVRYRVFQRSLHLVSHLELGLCSLLQKSLRRDRFCPLHIYMSCPTEFATQTLLPPSRLQFFVAPSP